MRDVIENALSHLTRDDPYLEAAIKRKQEEEYFLMVEKERKLIRCWRTYKERWE